MSDKIDYHPALINQQKQCYAFYQFSLCIVNASTDKNSPQGAGMQPELYKACLLTPLSSYPITRRTLLSRL